MLQPETVLDSYPLCPEGQDCIELAQGSAGQDAGPPAPPAVQVAQTALPPPPVAAEARPAPPAPEDGVLPPPEDSGLKILVSIPLQKAYVFEGDELVATSPVSTGKRGHETPAGTFRILQKKVHHRSNKYANAPMPYMQRLTSYGIALHAGRLPGYPASHGCIRLPHSFAKKLYAMTGTGTKVTVTRRRPRSAEEALTLA
jgi:lipoprotein-anchoring transpeptidase ErfK/SrfK